MAGGGSGELINPTGQVPKQVKEQAAAEGRQTIVEDAKVLPWEPPDEIGRPAGVRGMASDLWQKVQGVANTFLARAGLTEAATGAEVAAKSLKRIYAERLFSPEAPEKAESKMADFVEQGQRNPVAVRALADRERGVKLKPEQITAIENLAKDPAAKAAILDAWPRIMRFLKEVKDSGFVAAVRRDYGFPMGRRTLGDWIRALGEDATPEKVAEVQELTRISDELGIPIEDIHNDPTARAVFVKAGATPSMLGNLQKARGLDAVATELPTDTFIRYVDQVVRAQTTHPLAMKVNNWINHLENNPEGKNQASSVKNYLESGILKKTSSWDESVQRMLVNDILSQQYKVGDTFVSPPEADAPFHGTVRIESVQPIPGKKPGQKIGISIDGKPYPEKLSRFDVLAIEHAGAAKNRKPLSTLVGQTLRAEGLYILSFRPKSMWNSVFGNTSRTLSEFAGDGEALRFGVRKGFDYLRGKASPETVREYQDIGLTTPGAKTIVEQEGLTETSFPGDIARGVGTFFNKKAAGAAVGKRLDLFATKLQPLADLSMKHLSIPDEMQKVVHFEASKFQIAKNHPEWSQEQVRQAAIHATGIASDLLLQSLRPTMTGNPAFDAARFMKTSGLKTFDLLMKQIREAIKNPTAVNLSKPVLHTGLFVGQFLALYLALGGFSDAKLEQKIKKKMSDMTGPWLDAVRKGSLPLPIPFGGASGIGSLAKGEWF